MQPPLDLQNGACNRHAACGDHLAGDVDDGDVDGSARGLVMHAHLLAQLGGIHLGDAAKASACCENAAQLSKLELGPSLEPVVGTAG